MSDMQNGSTTTHGRHLVLLYYLIVVGLLINKQNFPFFRHWDIILFQDILRDNCYKVEEEAGLQRTR